MSELVTAGVEGGSKSQVEAEWTLADFENIRRYWRKFGPPAHVALVSVAAWMGFELCSQEDQAEADDADFSGPSIAELAAMVTPPTAGGDTLSATKAVLAALNARQ